LQGNGRSLGGALTFDNGNNKKIFFRFHAPAGTTTGEPKGIIQELERKDKRNQPEGYG